MSYRCKNKCCGSYCREIDLEKLVILCVDSDEDNIEKSYEIYCPDCKSKVSEREFRSCVNCSSLQRTNRMIMSNEGGYLCNRCHQLRVHGEQKVMIMEAIKPLCKRSVFVNESVRRIL